MTEADVTTRGNVLWHKKGYFSICIADSFKDSAGEVWVVYFNRNNASDTYAEHEGAFMSQFNDDVPTASPESIVLENFHKSNKLEVVSMGRMLNEDKFVTTEVPFKLYVPKMVGRKGSPIQHSFGSAPQSVLDSMPPALETLFSPPPLESSE